jgi:antitoxin component YwqK of YwqJK toxin-antitoxin module
LNITEKGAELNGVREGYWITLNENKAIIIESYYDNGALNGPIKFYNKGGSLMSDGFMQKDSSNGLWTYYYGNRKVSAKGQLRNGTRIGRWEFYVENGNLDKEILYKNRKDSVLIDNHLSVPVPGH